MNGRMILLGLCGVFLFPIYLYSAPGTMTLLPSIFDFGTVNTGRASASQIFTLTNSSGVTATGITVGLLGTDADDFDIVANNCAASINIGSSCNVTVQFAPGSEGSKTATLSIDSAVLPAVTASLAGMAIPAEDNDDDGCGLSADAASIHTARNRHRIPYAGLLLSMLIPMVLLMAGRSLVKIRKK